jgi:hypothetical protein
VDVNYAASDTNTMSENQTPEALAERCLARASDEVGLDGHVVLERAHELAASALVPVIGDAGFAAVFARAVRRAGAEYQELQAVARGSAPLPDALWDWIKPQSPSASHAVGTAVLTQLFGLLSTLIGDGLTTRLMDRALLDSNVPAITSASRRTDDE